MTNTPSFSGHDFISWCTAGTRPHVWSQMPTCQFTPWCYQHLYWRLSGSHHMATIGVKHIWLIKHKHAPFYSF